MTDAMIHLIVFSSRCEMGEISVPEAAIQRKRSTPMPKCDFNKVAKQLY